VLAQGLIRIEAAGEYNFTLESDDGAQLYVDNELVDDTRLDEAGELLHNNSASSVRYLQHGWHLARVVWFANTSANDAGYPEPQGTPSPQEAAAARYAVDVDRQRDFQDLRLSYTGPDTGGAVKLVKGYYLKGVAGTGSLKGIKLADGTTGSDGDDRGGADRNWAADFDQDWLAVNKDKKWRTYDDADHKEEIDDHVDKIVSPYTEYDEGANDHEHAEVPDEVYERAPPYDHEVVDIGGKGIKWKHAEADGSYLGTVIGKSIDWSDNWDKTPKSVAGLTGR